MAAPHLVTRDVPIGTTLRIRDCGFDEYWLQDQIYRNPASLQLGELEVVSKERQQARGGRLDLLLKDSDTDAMYEVEVMLGETDESHIVRTIEYWDNEKRRWPQRQHFAVLVAESITRRFFNVIQLLSQSIPIIALQANLIDVNGSRCLIFTKVLDVYEEPEDGGDVEQPPATEAYWRENAGWTLETARKLVEIMTPIFGQITLNYKQQYIGLRVNQNNYFWLNKRGGNKSRLVFRIDSERIEKVATLLDEAQVPYGRQSRQLLITGDQELFVAKAATLVKIARFVKEFWES